MTASAMCERLPPPEPLAAEGSALFIDLDGTLAAIEDRPQDVGPEPWRSRLLRRLNARLDGRLAVVSGRTLEDVDRILEGAAPAVAAVHGLVRRRADGMVERTAPHPGIGEARRRLAELTRAHPGLSVEDKGLALALHFRQEPALAALAIGAAKCWARALGLRLQLGRMVAELRTPGLDKGAAVRAFMAEPPFRGHRPVFLGDDLTDEDGFSAAQAQGGIGILVGAGRETRARRRLEDTRAVARWLEDGLGGATTP